MTKFIKNKVSVVIPLYGQFDVRRAILSIESILLQKNVDLEIIISEQGINPKMNLFSDERIKYTFKKHIPKKELSDFNPGKIRNDAVKLAKGEFIYTNDADIIFLNPNYLKECIRLIKTDSNLSLNRPPMRRLTIDQFELFWKTYKEEGIKNTLNKLDFSQKYLAVLDKKERPLKVVTNESGDYKKTFTTSIENFKSYISDKSLKGKEPMIWMEDLHCGGNFIRIKNFNIVGKYCEKFINWGCEDSDLQWKLKEKLNLSFFPYKKKFEVLHLDHPKGYFSPEMWKRNEKISQERIQKGVEMAIFEDKNE